MTIPGVGPLLAGALVATAVVRYAQRRGIRWAWLVKLLERRPTKVATIALANVVLLQHLAAGPVFAVDGGKPAGADISRQCVLAIAPQTGDSYPLQRRPAIGRVPLLPGPGSCGPQPSRGQQP